MIWLYKKKVKNVFGDMEYPEIHFLKGEVRGVLSGDQRIPTVNVAHEPSAARCPAVPAVSTNRTGCYSASSMNDAVLSRTPPVPFSVRSAPEKHASSANITWRAPPLQLAGADVARVAVAGEVEEHLVVLRDRALERAQPVEDALARRLPVQQVLDAEAERFELAPHRFGASF